MESMRVMTCLLLAALSLAGADVSGKWSGTAEVKVAGSEPQQYVLQLQLTQKGEQVNGTVGRADGEETAIQEGRLQGTKFTFQVTPPETLGPVKFELVLNGDRLEGDLKGAVDSGPLTGKVLLSKTK
jgi:hypothetical protein